MYFLLVCYNYYAVFLILIFSVFLCFYSVLCISCRVDHWSTCCCLLAADACTFFFLQIMRHGSMTFGTLHVLFTCAHIHVILILFWLLLFRNNDESSIKNNYNKNALKNGYQRREHTQKNTNTHTNTQKSIYTSLSLLSRNELAIYCNLSFFSFAAGVRRARIPKQKQLNIEIELKSEWILIAHKNRGNYLWMGAKEHEQRFFFNRNFKIIKIYSREVSVSIVLFWLNHIFQFVQCLLIFYSIWIDIVCVYYAAWCQEHS